MHSIGAIAAGAAADGLGGITSHLPWGWFGLLAIVDVVLVSMVVARRLHGRPGASGTRRGNPPLDALVLRSGWWVPRSRTLGLPSRRSTYAWPLHREYMVCRVV